MKNNNIDQNFLCTFFLMEISNELLFSHIACYDVAIIGAGISGTYAAWRLRHSGRKIGIFEQWDRIGGRIHTHRLPGMPELHAELGAMYYMPQVFIRCESLLSFSKHKFILKFVSHVYQQNAYSNHGSKGPTETITSIPLETLIKASSSFENAKCAHVNLCENMQFQRRSLYQW